MSSFIVFGVVGDLLHADAIVRDLALDGVGGPDVVLFTARRVAVDQPGTLPWASPSVSGLAGALAQLGLSKFDADLYERRVRDGNVLLCVRTERQLEVDRILRAQRVIDGMTLELVEQGWAAAPITRPSFFPARPTPPPADVAAPGIDVGR